MQTIQQILATRIDWLGFVLIGFLLGELGRAVARLFKGEDKPKKVVPFHRPSPPDPAATLPIRVIRLEETRIDPEDLPRGPECYW